MEIANSARLIRAKSEGVNMTTEAINPKRLGGACREVNFFIAEHAITELEKLIAREEAAYLEKDPVTPTREETWLSDALHTVQRGLDEGKRYPALIEAAA